LQPTQKNNRLLLPQVWQVFAPAELCVISAMIILLTPLVLPDFILILKIIVVNSRLWYNLVKS